MCFNNIFTIFTMLLQYIRKLRVHNVSTICSQGTGLQYFYNMFARRVFYNNFLNISTITLFPRSILFTIYIHRGDGVPGSPLFLRYNSLYYTLSLSAGNWDYLYYWLLRQELFYSLLGKGG